MELKILGMYGPYGKAGVGAASGYLVKQNDTTLLLDMGSGVLSRLINEIDIATLSGIFISHLHYDHTSDLLPFRYLLEERNLPMTIYTHKEDSAWYKILFDHPLFNIVNIDENASVLLGDLHLSFFLMNHPITNYAIRIVGDKTLVYTGDTTYCDNIYNAISGADCVIADCSKPPTFIGGHMSATTAIELHKKSGVRIIASHLSPDYSPDKLFADYDKIEVAKELVTYKI